MLIRPAKTSDWGFIVSSFINSFREESTHAEGLKGKTIAALLTNLVSQGWNCTVAEFVASEDEPEGPGVIAGWVVSGPTSQALAWAYTRSMFRRQGLAKLLLQRVGIDMAKPVTSPFVPNRHKDRCPLKLRINHRPFLAVQSADAQN